MTAHADASPSAASIWLNCPASVTLARGKKRRATVYTREGSAAHAAAERMIYGMPPPDEVEIDGETVAVDDDMVEHVQVYVDFVSKLAADADHYVSEARVTVPEMPEPISGTADFIAWTGTRIDVVDLKYGKGVPVSAKDNPQLWIYALGAAYHPRTRGSDVVEEVHVHVVQPRTAGPSVESQVISADELLDFRRVVLKPALARIAIGDPTETPGQHCRWCVRAGECKALAGKAQIMAQEAFNDEATVKRNVAGLSNTDLAAILDNEHLIKAWLEFVRLEATSRVDTGQEIPGYKLVAKKAIRKWLDETVVAGILNRLLPVSAYTKVVSPAAVERALKTKTLPPNLQVQIEKKSSGTTLVREEDAREGLKTDAKSVFNPLRDDLIESLRT